MEYIKKLANDETWDCATFSGMCRFVGRQHLFRWLRAFQDALLQFAGNHRENHVLRKVGVHVA